MQGLEFIDVPGLCIFAIGAGVMGVMLLFGGSRKRDREVVDRLHAARPELEAHAEEIAICENIDPVSVAPPVAAVVAVDVTAFAEPDELTAPEVSGCYDSTPVEQQPLIEPDYDDATPVYGYTSADLAQCRAGLEVKPFRRNWCG